MNEEPNGPPIDIKQQNCRCLRCDHAWVSRVLAPKRCPMCRSPYWNVKRGTIPRGRPKGWRKYG